MKTAYDMSKSNFQLIFSLYEKGNANRAHVNTPKIEIIYRKLCQFIS